MSKSKAQRQAESRAALADQQERAIAEGERASERYMLLPGEIVEAIVELMRAQASFDQMRRSDNFEYANETPVIEAKFKLEQLLEEYRK